MLDPAESPIAHRDRTHGNLALVSRPFILILAIMVMVAAASLDLLSSIRAYVGGEGLYSKGQKDAVYYLARYARSRTESDYDRYAAAIAVPLGDREARLALQSSPVDITHARAGFLAGGNDPADVRGMIWLFRCCSTVAPMNSAVAIWTAADSYNARIDGIALSLRTATSLGSSPDQVSRAVADLDEINSRLGPLENQFSQLLGGLARLARTVLIFFLGISGIALGLIAARAARIRLAERRHYELALKASEERYRSVFKASADAVLILGRDGTVLAANPAARRLFADGADTTSTRDFELHSDTLALPQSGAAGEFRRDMQFSRRDGELFIGEASYVSFIDSNGEQRWSVAIRDLTERRRLELERLRARDEAAAAHAAMIEANRRHDARFRALIESSTNMVAVVTAHGGFTYRSPGWVAALGEEPDTDPRSLTELCHPDDARTMSNALLALIEGAPPVEGRVRLAHRDGTWRQVSWAATSAIAVAGVEGIIVTGTDVTQQLALADQLHAAQRMQSLGQLAGGIAHDFNNIISVVMGHASLALRQVPQGEPLARALASVVRACERAAALTQKLLALGRSQVPRTELFPLNSVVDDTIKMIARIIPEDIVVDLRLAPDSGDVRADRSELEQVLMNLALNARDAMPNGGRLTISTARAGDATVCLTVADTGEGMDEATRLRAFEPFFTTKGPRGAGLGLSTVYGIVNGSGGRVAIDSRPGAGCTISVLLPRLAVVADKQTESVEAPDAGSGTVLVAEDQEELRELIGQALIALGYRPILVESGNAALLILADAEVHIDLLLTDLVMPGMNGVELGEHAVRLRPALKVLYMSGYAPEQEHRGRFTRDGAAFLQKPFGPNELAGKLAKLLRS